ncbi:MAG: rhomboid family intramembrane serine protease [Nocardioidaceae bacterium]
MSAKSPPPDAGTSTTPHCYRHPDRETYISCQRCGRPICPDCMNQASVGFQCPECLRQGRDQTPTARTSFGGRVGSHSPVLTMTLIAINVAVFLLLHATNGLNGDIGKRLVEIPSSAGYAPALNLEGVAQGSYWQLVTSTFTHYDILHIAMNMIGLWIFGSFLEYELGRWRFLALYLLTGVVGSVAVYLLAEPHVAALGASGSVFGLFAAAFVVLLRQRRDVTQLVVLLVLNLFISFTVANIAWQAHIGGMLAGFAIGAAYAYAPRQQRTIVHGVVLTVVLVTCVVAVVLRTASLTA